MIYFSIGLIIKIIFVIVISYLYEMDILKKKKRNIIYFTIVIFILFILLDYIKVIYYYGYGFEVIKYMGVVNAPVLVYSTEKTMPFLFLLLLIFYSENLVNKKLIIKSFLFCFILYLIPYYIYFFYYTIIESITMFILMFTIKSILKFLVYILVYFVALKIFFKLRSKYMLRKIDFDNDKIEIINIRECNKKDIKSNKKDYTKIIICALLALIIIMIIFIVLLYNYLK